jgi:hypothetical protein
MLVCTLLATSIFVNAPPQAPPDPLTLRFAILLGTQHDIIKINEQVLELHEMARRKPADARECQELITELKQLQFELMTNYNIQLREIAKTIRSRFPSSWRE